MNIVATVGPSAPGHVRVPLLGARPRGHGLRALQEGSQAGGRAPHAARAGRRRHARAAALRQRRGARRRTRPRPRRRGGRRRRRLQELQSSTEGAYFLHMYRLWGGYNKADVILMEIDNLFSLSLIVIRHAVGSH